MIMLKYYITCIMHTMHLISETRYNRRMHKYTPEYKAIARSKYFNKNYYLKHNPDVRVAHTDPVNHYLTYGWKEGRKCMAKFDGDAYLQMYPDVAVSGMNPLVHFELYGKKEGRKINQINKITNKTIQNSFPKNCKNIQFCSNDKTHKKRLIIFASYFNTGIIPDYVIYYLKELKKIGDIIFIADNPVIKSEKEKIKDLVIYAQFKRHGEYDFGSYKRGFMYAKQHGLLKNVNQLVMCNDSCYGPIYPLKTVFETMNKKQCDFWGMLSNTDVKYHIQSWFLVFNKKVLNSGVLYKFLNSVKKEKSFNDIVFKYEYQLTKILQNAGFVASEFVNSDCDDFEHSYFITGNKNSCQKPFTLINTKNLPFAKIKTFTNGYDSYFLQESPKLVLDLIKIKNYELYKHVVSDLNKKGISIKDVKKADLIAKYKVISFDIFDTLLIRPYAKPTDMFLHIERIYDASGFAIERIAAENRARIVHKNQSDVTLDQIYDVILPKFKSMKEIELKFEEKFLSRHPKNFEIYKQAINMGKKIIAVSDMYLPSKFLKQLLKKNGYNKIDKIYVSCEQNKTKGSGELFDYVIKHEKVSSKYILHIGDNKISDYEMPLSKQMGALHVPNILDNFFEPYGNFKFKEFYTKFPALENSILVSLFAVHQLNTTNNYWTDIGYYLGGPLALGYVQHIISESKKNNIDTLLFVSRDGYILQKIYNYIEKKALFNLYIYASRILNIKCFGEYSNEPSYLKQLLEFASEKIPGLENISDDFEENKKLLQKYEKEITEYVTDNRKSYMRYLSKLKIKGNNIASVDMMTGAFTSEKFLKRLFKEKYAMSFFCARFRDEPSLIYDLYYKKQLMHNDDPWVMLTELLVTAPELPLKNLVDDKPVFKEATNYDTERIEVIKKIHDGIMQFVQDYKQKFGEYMIQIPMETNITLLYMYMYFLSATDDTELKKIYHSGNVANDDFVSLYNEIKNLVK